MEEAVRSRRAARETVRDITPTRLRAVIENRLESSAMVPGVLTFLSARVVPLPDGGPVVGETVSGDGVDVTDETARRAAGVQLIYEGLRLTRRLVHEEAWAGDGSTLDADVDILAADVLVARGFSLLAHTAAAETAVAVVREFGRQQTDRRVGRLSVARELEEGVFELAAVAGATIGGGDAPTALRQYLVGLAAARRAGVGTPPLDALVFADDLLPETIEEVMRRVSTPVEGRPSAGSTNRND